MPSKQNNKNKNDHGNRNYLEHKRTICRKRKTKEVDTILGRIKRFWEEMFEGVEDQERKIQADKLRQDKLELSRLKDSVRQIEAMIDNEKQKLSRLSDIHEKQLAERDRQYRLRRMLLNLIGKLRKAQKQILVELFNDQGIHLPEED